ncbi:MAG: preprotein translocase subunit SecE [Oscillospiraceae bacterium]|jgi:preprotein translocase subunit SecE|nr:preprotein translocase subunit SecE [Oscillospiraceae bacterium]
MSDERNDELELEDAAEASESEKHSKPSKTDAKSGGKRKKVKKKSRFARWFREMRSELKKVVWPTPKQVINNTLIALAVIVVSGIVIWAVDQVSSQIINALRTIAKPVAELPQIPPTETPAETVTEAVGFFIRTIIGG